MHKTQEHILIKKQYFKEFTQLRNMMNDWDPLSFIELGAPEDEYDAITVKLLSSLLQGKNKKELEKVIRKELLEDLIADPEEEKTSPKLDKDVERFAHTVSHWFNKRESSL